MRRLAPVLGILLCGATCERRSEQRLVATGQEDASTSSTAAVEVERESKETRGPVEVTTTTEDYAPCDPLSCPQDVGEVVPLRPDAGPARARAVLKRRVVRVERREPVVRETRQEARAEAQGTTETHAGTKAEQTARVETERTAGPPAWAWAFAPVLVLAVLAAGMWAKQRFGWWA